MLGPVDFNPAGLDQRGANGVGATLLFVPVGSARQGDPISPAQKIGMTQGMQQRAALVGQDHHALGVAHLFKQMFHHRARMGQQLVVAPQGAAQVGGTGVLGVVQVSGGQQTCGQTAPPRARHALIKSVGRTVAMFKQMQSGLAQGQGGRGCFHDVSWRG